MGLRRVVQGVGLGDPEGQDALVDQSGQLGERAAVGVHLDRADPHPAHRRRFGVRDDADVGAAVAHPLQGRLAEERRVEHGVEAALVGAREPGRPQRPYELLVRLPGQRRRGDPAVRGELEGVPADRPRGTGHQQRLARLHPEQVKGLYGGQGVQRKRGRVHGVGARGGLGHRVRVHDDVLGVRAVRLQRAVDEGHDVLADGPVGGRAGRVHRPGDVPAKADPLPGAPEDARPDPGVDRVQRGRRHLDPYLAGARLRHLGLHELHGLGSAERRHHCCAHV